jgi:hypothetical protein
VTAPRVRLEAPGLVPLQLTPEGGWAIQQFDLGDAETRVVTEYYADANGTNDLTAYIGARTVALSLKLLPTRSGLTKQAMRDRLLAFTHPRLRPLMYISRDGEVERQLMVRRSQFQSVLSNPAYADVTLQFVAPYGVIESTTLDVLTLNATASAGSEGGRGYDASFDRVYVGGVALGTGTAQNDGTADAYPLIQVYGPCTNPIIYNTTQGKQLAFTGLTINAGEFLEIDTRNKTIRYLGNAADSRYNTLVPAVSSWWTLQPGANTLRFAPATSSAPAQAVVNFRDTWL